MLKSFNIVLVFFSALINISCVWNGVDDNSEFLPLDDSEYPYSGLPRLVIETDDFTQVRNRDDIIPSKLQIYEEKGPKSNIMDLTIKGRGHSSFMMAKYSIKLKFNEKQSLFGMTADKEWDLISNQRDKSMLRNYITSQLADILQDDYSPHCNFVELFLNRNYMGVYLLVEHVKVAKHRVNLPKTDSSFLFEKTRETDENDIYFVSFLNCTFNIKYPKVPQEEGINLLKTHINDFERELSSDSINLTDWIDVEDFVRYYWIQEFSKNIDGAFGRSIFITWEQGKIFKMGPVWDFDLAYGLGNERVMSSCDWYVRYQGWYKYLFKNETFRRRVKQYWTDNREYFQDLIDSVNSASKILKTVSKSEFNRWPVLNNNKQWPFVDSYDNYDQSVNNLKTWIKNRIQWIDSHL